MRKVKFIKEHWIFILIFTAVAIFMLKDIFLLKSGFIEGDYQDQFYPWSRIYSDSIKHFQFPFWNRYFHSGFPLMAEGQLGGFYPLNILMFFILPFKAAYNYSILLHFMLAGIFAYIYARKLAADKWGATLTAVIFCFGSTYAGCFLNVATLKTAIWFPLVLCLLENYLDTGKIRYILYSGIITGMQLLAGSMQMGVYSIIFYCIYFIYGVNIRKRALVKNIIFFIPALIIAGAIFIWQLLLSLQLVEFSMRANPAIDFALWKSFPPPFLIGAFFPYWINFTGYQIYIGVLSLLFLIYAVMALKTDLKLRPLALLGIISLLAAFGKYNPAYTVILKTIGYYGFRNPSKLLFFALFSASVLAGVGYSMLFNKNEDRRVKAASKAFAWVLGFFVFIFFAAKAFLYAFKDRIKPLLNDYVLGHIYGKAHHRHSLQSYLDRVNNTYQLFLDSARLDNKFIIVSLAFIALAVIACIYLYRRTDRKALLKFPIFGIIILDMCIYSFFATGFRGNIKPFSNLEFKSSPILKVLQADREFFRVLPFDLTSQDKPAWISPNANALYGVDSIAAYTPLALKKYKEALSGLEVVDDSMGVISPQDNVLIEQHGLLRALNVKYIISARELKYDFLEKVKTEGNISLYKIKDFLPKFFFTDSLDSEPGSFTQGYTIEVIKYTDGNAEVKMQNTRDGYLIFSECFYPGWQVFVDGERQKLLTYKNILQAVKLSKGSHWVVFKYRPVLKFIKNEL